MGTGSKRASAPILESNAQTSLSPRSRKPASSRSRCITKPACISTVVRIITAHGCRLGVVINPGTPVRTFDEVVPLVHHVLIMSVHPGFGGQTSEIRRLRGPDFRIEVDEGVHHDTVADIVLVPRSWSRAAPSSSTAIRGAPGNSSVPLLMLQTAQCKRPVTKPQPEGPSGWNARKPSTGLAKVIAGHSSHRR
jgi:Ribulose-phosphate 3 epimerase family